MSETPNSPYIHTATSENFKQRVLENSDRGPVLVNFWSSRASPCLRQYPILEQLIHHYAGKVLLINVDTDHELEVTREHDIVHVPTLKLFRRGQVVETLHGFQSETELKKLLEQYVSRDSDPKLADAIELFTGGQARAAYERIAELMVEDPANPRLPLTMSKLLHHEGRYDEALRLLESLPEEIRSHQELQQFFTLLSFFAELENVADMASLEARLEQAPDDLQLKRQQVTHLVTQQQTERALELLVEIMTQDPAYDAHDAQRTMLRIFAILGHEHPLVVRFLPQLQRYVH
ncbi:MAG: tetratricopeptide repeat protein [Gammaproteobacteria bacterium]